MSVEKQKYQLIYSNYFKFIYFDKIKIKKEKKDNKKYEDM